MCRCAEVHIPVLDFRVEFAGGMFGATRDYVEMFAPFGSCPCANDYGTSSSAVPEHGHACVSRKM